MQKNLFLAGIWILAISSTAWGTALPTILLNCNETSSAEAADSGGVIADSAQLQSVGRSSAYARQALFFDPALKSVASIPSSVETNPRYKFTYAFWLRPSAWTEGQTVLFRAGTDARRAAYRVHYRSQWLWFEVDGNTFHLNPPAPGAWTHVTLTFDGFAYRAYYNGALQNDYIFRAELPSVTGPLLLGTSSPTGPTANFYHGRLDDFRLYDRALSSLEIYQLVGRNAPPMASGFTRQTAQNLGLALTLSGRDLDGTVTSFQIVSPPSHGLLSGTLPQPTYTPASGYLGADSFTYRCFDGADWSPPVVVTLNVSAPSRPIALNQELALDEDVSRAFVLTGTNLGSGLSYQITESPRFGSVSGTPPNLSYAPGQDYTGNDSLQFTITDIKGVSTPAFIAFTVAGSNDATAAYPRSITVRSGRPTNITLSVADAEDAEWLHYTLSAPTHGVLTGQPPYVVYTPANGYTGTDSFSFTATDGASVPAAATVAINVQAMATFNVRTYGAVGNGLVDDTLPIRTAIAAAEQAGGGTVYFPPGTYAIAPQASDPSWINDSQPSILEISGRNIELLGDGPTHSIISVYTIGLQDPKTHWTVVGDGTGYAKIKRGGAFTLTNTRVEKFENIVFRGLRITGNTPQTGDSSVGGNPVTGDGWDLSHKCIRIPDSVGENVLIENCQLDSWRGEIVYGGGNQHNRIFVRDTIIHDSNASAISIGSIICERVTISNVYNGVENFALGYPQLTVMKDCHIQGAKWGIVYLGRSTSRCTITGTTAIECSQGAVFLSELARNVTVRDNTFIDNAFDLYAIYLNQYPSIPEEGFEGILFQHNISKAVQRSHDVYLMYYGGDARFWTFRDNETLISNGNTINRYIIDGYNGGLESRRNYYVLDNNIAATRPYSGDGNHIRPLWYGNTVNTALNVFDYSGIQDPPLEVEPEWNRISIGDYTSDGRPLSLLGAIPFLPVGFEIEFYCYNSLSQPTGAELPPNEAWNTFDRGYMLYNGAIAKLRLNAERKFDLVSYQGPPGTSHTVNFGNSISARGFDQVNLSPYQATTYTSFVGIGENATVLIGYSALVSIQNNSKIRTPNGGTWVGSGNGFLSGTRIGDVLYLTQSTSNLPSPSLSALAISTGEVALNWSTPLNGTTSVVLERQLSGASTFVTLATLPALTVHYTDAISFTGLGPLYRIKVVSSSGVSYSPTVRASQSLLNWRLTALGSSSITGLNADTVDRDNDLIVNLIEYATRRDPLNADAGDGPLTIDLESNGGLSSRFVRQSPAHLIFTLENSTDLTTWSPLATLRSGVWTLDEGVTVAETTPLNGAVEVKFHIAPAALDPLGFYRLQIGY